MAFTHVSTASKINTVIDGDNVTMTSPKTKTKTSSSFYRTPAATSSPFRRTPVNTYDDHAKDMCRKLIVMSLEDTNEAMSKTRAGERLLKLRDAYRALDTADVFCFDKEDYDALEKTQRGLILYIRVLEQYPRDRFMQAGVR